MFNKKVLIEALKKVDAAKARTKKGKDVILDQEGQRKHPGQITQIQGDTMATDGYGDIPLMVYPNNGQPPQVVQANTGEHYFPGATNFTEVPLDMAKRGGIKSKKYSRSLLATNKLYKKNPLYKKKNYKSKTYDPMAMYFQEGGPKAQYYTYGKSKNQYKKIGNQWYISNDATDFKWQPIHDPTGNRAKELNKNAKVNPNPWVQNPKTIEGKINKAMGDPQGQSARAAAFYARPGEDDVDNLRHADAARRTQQAIAKATGSDLLGYFGSVGLGVGHELGTMFTDSRPWGVVLQEGYEDIRNNNLGAEMGYFHTPNATKRLNYLSQTYQMPDGYGPVKPFPGSNWKDPYDQIQRQKAQQEVWNNPNPKPASLTEKFGYGGDISVPELTKAQRGLFVPKNFLSYGADPASLDEILGLGYGPIRTEEIIDLPYAPPPKKIKKKTSKVLDKFRKVTTIDANPDKPFGESITVKEEIPVYKEEEVPGVLGAYGKPLDIEAPGDNLVEPYQFGQYASEWLNTTTEGRRALRAIKSREESEINRRDMFKREKEAKKAKTKEQRQKLFSKPFGKYTFEDGGYVEAELTRQEIDDLIAQGHRIEEAVPTKAQFGLAMRTGSNIARGLQGASEFRNMMNMLNEADDILPTDIPASVNMAKGLQKVTPKLPSFKPKAAMSFSPSRIAASRPLSPDSFSPIRFGDDYVYKGSEWYHVNPEDYLPKDFKKIGLQDASDSLKSYLSKLNPYSPDTFKGMGDFRFKDFSEGSNFRRDMLAAAAGPQRQLSTEDFFTDDELIRMAHQQADYWNARDQFDIDNPEDPTNMIFGALTGDRSRDELFSLLYPNASMPNWREKFILPHQEKITRETLGDMVPGLNNQGKLSKPALKTAIGSFPKEVSSEAAKVRELQDKKGYLFTADPKMVVMEMRGSLGLKLDDIKNASPEQLEKWRQQIIEKVKARDLERYKALLGNPFTAGDAYSKMTLNKYGGVPKAQLGALVKGAKQLGRLGNIATLGTLNSAIKTVAPIMIHPLGFAEMVGPFTGSPLNYVPGYGKTMNHEHNTAFRKFGDTLDYVKLTGELTPAHGPLLRYSRIKTPEEGNWAEYGEPNEGYSGVFGAKFDFNHPDTNLGFKKLSNRKGVLITDAQGNKMPAISVQDPGLSFHRRLPFSNRYIPIDMDKLRNDQFDWRTQGGNLQSLAERYGYAAAIAGGLAAMGNPYYQETLDKYVTDPVSRFVENSKKQMEEFLKGSPVKKK